MGAHAEVLDSLPRVPLATEQDGVRAGRCPDGEGVKSQGLATGLEYALLRRLGESECSDGQLGDFKKTNVIGDSSDNHDSLRLAVGSVGGLLEYTGEGDRGLVDLREEETVEDGLLKDS